MGVLARKLMDAPAASGYSCNITIGDNGSNYGYSSPSNLDFGSISGEPVPGYPLGGVLWASDGSIIIVSFSGNCVSLLTALNVYINSVNYGGAGSWSFEDPNTAFLAFAGPTLTSGTYLFEIK